MPKLMRNLNPVSDTGAIAPLFLILLGTGMLLMLMGLVVDGGQVFVQKRLVQNAAENVAEAIAQHCAKELAGTIDCLNDDFKITPAASTLPVSIGGQSWQATVADYLSVLANPKGGSVAVTNICGQTSTTLGIPLCPPLSDSPNDCKTDLSAAGYENWIRVYTSTDPAGFAPAFENFLSGGTQARYQETACSQVYWGKGNSVPIYAAGNQLPLMIGLCSVTLNQPTSAVNLPIRGADTDKSACGTFRDRDGRAQSAPATAHGFFTFDPGSGNHSCWNLQQGGCTPLALPASAAVSSLVSTVRTNVKKPVVLPVVDWSGSNLKVVSYVSFYLTYYKFYSYSYTTTNPPTGCNSNPTNFCVIGQFQNKIIQPFGQVQGLDITTNSDVPNLGYQVLRHVS
jgi:hypothetical protein